MKTRCLYGAALSALVLTACSQEEVVNMRQDGISYNVLAKNQTRAADSYCNNVLPADFRVWASENGVPYISNDLIVKEGNSWVDQSGTRYWPQGSTLDFFAQKNGDDVFDFNGGAPKFNNFKVKDNVPEQVDLIYAVQKGETRDGQPVTLNFRHALSQVCFRAQNTTENLNITINSVTVGHLTNGGTYTFPATNTSDNYTHPDHGDAADPNAPALNGGNWDLDGNYTNKYVASVNGGSKTLAAASDAIINLTCPTDQHAEGFTNVMTLMPQEVPAWDPAQTDTDYNGAYFLLNVEMKDKDSNKVIYSGETAIPVKVNWHQGYRYIYTFKFTKDGNGGYTPNPDDPKPVLAGIEYEVSVDDFIPVSGDGNGTEMDTNKPGTENPEPEPQEYQVNLTLNKWEGNVENDSFKTTENPYTVNLGKYDATREGYEFLGWSTTEGATVAQYPAGTNPSVTLSNEVTELTYYAVYKQKMVTFRLNFRENNPSTSGLTVSGMPNPDFIEVQLPEGTESYEFTIPDATPAIGNWSFEGYAETDRAFADTPKWKIGEKYTVTAKNPVVDLYVVWGTKMTGGSTPGAGGTGW